MSLALPPWLKPLADELAESLAQNRVAPALLIKGPRGVGKTRLARHHAQRLLCLSAMSEKGCGHCRACALFQAGTHPDFIQLAPEAPQKPIKVDAIRQLALTVGLTPHYGIYRVVLIDQAEQLNLHAANALLKTLEEPPLGTVLMLVSEAPQRLPLTIRSRCSSIRVRQPDRRVVLEWLHHQGLGDQAATRLDGVGGAPLTALREDSVEGLARRLPCFDAFAGVFEGRLDPLEVAENWATQLGDLELRWLFDWLAALIRLSMDLGAEAVVSHQDLLPRLEALARRGRRDFFFETQARFMDVLEALDGPCNRQLVFEVFLMDWASAPRA